MKLALLRSTALAFALTAGAGLAFAQSGSLALTDAQKSAIHAALSAPEVRNEAVQPAPTAGENFRVGATLAENQLLDIPQQTAAQIPSVQGYKYSVMGEEVALVEPESRRIVTILR